MNLSHTGSHRDLEGEVLTQDIVLLMINSKVSNSILHANIRIYASPARNPL